jgi:hypothetical protein
VPNFIPNATYILETKPYTDSDGKRIRKGPPILVKYIGITEELELAPDGTPRMIQKYIFECFEITVNDTQMSLNNSELKIAKELLSRKFFVSETRGGRKTRKSRKM